MADSIFWYDYETTGTHSVLDRPLQFAGIRTDLSLKEIAEPVNVLCSPGQDVLPEPEALLVTGIMMSKVRAEGLTEKEFCDHVLVEFEVPGTCVAGFNNIRFDDEFTRQMFYRNFRDPYAREWRNGNSRWDVIDFFRAAYALRPEGFTWPEREPGIPSFRLEDLARVNGVEHEGAHDALADVRATIEITRLLRASQPKLYEFARRLRNKKAVVQQLYPLGKQPVVHVSSMYSAKEGCTAVVLPLCQHPTNRNAIICFDLSNSPDPLLEADPKTLARLVFSRKDQLSEGEERLLLKSLHLNRSPMVAPISTLGEAEANRLGIDLSRCDSHLEALRGRAGLIEKIHEAFTTIQFDEIDDPDFQLYSGSFFSDDDRSTMNELVVTGSQNLNRFIGSFQDKRLDEMLFRYRCRNWPETLTEGEKARWQLHCEARWQADGRAGRVEAKLSQLMDIEKGDRLLVLQDLRRYIDSL